MNCSYVPPHHYDAVWNAAGWCRGGLGTSRQARSRPARSGRTAQSSAAGVPVFLAQWWFPRTQQQLLSALASGRPRHPRRPPTAGTHTAADTARSASATAATHSSIRRQHWSSSSSRPSRPRGMRGCASHSTAHTWHVPPHTLPSQETRRNGREGRAKTHQPTRAYMIHSQPHGAATRASARRHRSSHCAAQRSRVCG
jgi:hypothetical protein